MKYYIVTDNMYIEKEYDEHRLFKHGNEIGVIRTVFKPGEEKHITQLDVTLDRKYSPSTSFSLTRKELEQILNYINNIEHYTPF